jgi:hypothetical protein
MDVIALFLLLLSICPVALLFWNKPRHSLRIIIHNPDAKQLDKTHMVTLQLDREPSIKEINQFVAALTKQ